jgi:hypothetical protein
MTSFRQNVLYIFIIFIVFFGCLKAFAEDIRAEPKGVFLPSSNFVATDAISIGKIKIQMLNHTINTKDSLGSVMVTGHQNSKNITHNELCKSNLKVAIKIAAENGMSNLKYYCLPFDEQKDVELRSFGFRELN